MQEFPVRYPQDFPARISRKIFPQNFLQEFPTRISNKNFPQEFPKAGILDLVCINLVCVNKISHKIYLDLTFKNPALGNDSGNFAGNCCGKLLLENLVGSYCEKLL